MTPEQQRTLDRLNRYPSRWFVTNRHYWKIVERFERDNQRHYYWLLNRVTTYDGSDYRVRLVDEAGVPQPGMIRATRSQYEQAQAAGLECRIEVHA